MMMVVTSMIMMLAVSGDNEFFWGSDSHDDGDEFECDDDDNAHNMYLIHYNATLLIYLIFNQMI